MSTTITGNPTAAGVAPDAGPQPEATPQVTAFADGEAANAASVLQLFTTVANHLAFLHKRRAKANDFEGHVEAWRNAQGQKRAGIDHLGLPAGQYLSHDVNWLGSGVTLAGSSKTGTAASPDLHFGTMPNWTYRALQTTGTTRAFMASNNFGPALYTLSGDTVNDYVLVFSNPFGTLRDSIHLALELGAYGPQTDTRSVCVGIADGFGGAGIDFAIYFMGFRAGIDPGGHWECITRGPSGEEVTVTTEVAIAPVGGPPERLRVEWHGGDVAEDSTRAVRFYIDGALVATHTTDLPPIGTPVVLAISDRRVSAPGAGTPSENWQIGPLRLRMTTTDEDTIL